MNFSYFAMRAVVMGVLLWLIWQNHKWALVVTLGLLFLQSEAAGMILRRLIKTLAGSKKYGKQLMKWARVEDIE